MYDSLGFWVGMVVGGGLGFALGTVLTFVGVIGGVTALGAHLNAQEQAAQPAP